jgi:hypothetical protein
LGKKAELIPWEEIEVHYAKLFSNKKEYNGLRKLDKKAA